MKTKSRILKKLAKKQRYKILKIKLAKVKPEDYKGFPYLTVNLN